MNPLTICQNRSAHALGSGTEIFGESEGEGQAYSVADSGDLRPFRLPPLVLWGTRISRQLSHFCAMTDMISCSHPINTVDEPELPMAGGSRVDLYCETRSPVSLGSDIACARARNSVLGVQLRAANILRCTSVSRRRLCR